MRRGGSARRLLNRRPDGGGGPGADVEGEEGSLGAKARELTRSGPDQDRYGRKLLIALRDGRSIGDQMVAEGFART